MILSEFNDPVSACIRRLSIGLLVIACAALSLTPLRSNAQEYSSTPVLDVGRASLGIQAALKPLVDKFSPSVIEIESDFGKRTLGTIVSSDGLIIAKRSELSKLFY